MKEMTVGELKARFADVLQRVKAGETVVITYGKEKQTVAAIIPPHRYDSQAPAGSAR